MATKTMGTTGTTTYTALQFPSFSATSFSDADVAAIAAAIIDDEIPPRIEPGAFSRMGLLYVPNRGVLKLRKGDWVAVGPEGWPILISPMASATTNAINGTPISGSAAMVMASSVLVAGWKIGGVLAGTGMAAGAKIANISADGLTVTMSANATSSPGATAITYGSFVHS